MIGGDELLRLAGERAYARGRAYHREGRIALARVEDDRIDGEARGSEDYPLWLRRENGRWRWGCACPAADGGAFCKHLVAAVLTARGQAAEAISEDAAPETTAAKKRRMPAPQGNLSDFLRAQPAERLAGSRRRRLGRAQANQHERMVGLARTRAGRDRIARARRGVASRAPARPRRRFRWRGRAGGDDNVHADTLGDLARRLERDRPLVAGEFYLRIADWIHDRLGHAVYPRFVSVLARAARCLPSERWRPIVEAIRTAHGRKTRLMSLMDEAGL
jgi:hypothetical protein